MDEFDPRPERERPKEAYPPSEAPTELNAADRAAPELAQEQASAPLEDPYEPARPWIIGALACLIIGAFAFIGGWWLGRETGQREILPNSSAMRGSGPTQVISGTTSPEELREQFQLYWDVWDLVAQEFYHEGPVDQKE